MLSLASALLNNHLGKHNDADKKDTAYAYQDSIQMRACGMVANYPISSDKQRIYLFNLSDALLEICLKNFGDYSSTS